MVSNIFFPLLVHRLLPPPPPPPISLDEICSGSPTLSFTRSALSPWVGIGVVSSLRPQRSDASSGGWGHHKLPSKEIKLGMIRKSRLSINKVRSPMWKADHFTSTAYCIRTEQLPSEDRKWTLDNIYYECSTTGKPTRSFATERVSLDSV